MERGRGGGGGRSAYFRGGWKSRAFSSRGTGNRGRGQQQQPPKRGNIRGGHGSSSREIPQQDNISRNSSSLTWNDDSDSEHVIPKKTIRRQPAIDKLLLAQMEKKYPGYYLYFPSPPEISDPDKKIQAAKEYLTRKRCHNRQYILDIEELECFDENYKDINEDGTLKESWPTFPEDFGETPEHVFKIFGLAMHSIIFETASQEDDYDDGLPSGFQKDNINLPYIRCGIMKDGPIKPLKSIKASLLGKLVTVRGSIIRMGVHKLQCTRLTFRCGDCLKEFWLEQPEGRYTPPKRCGASEICENRKKENFDPVPTASTTKVIEFRRIRIQDVDNSRLEHGRIPRTIDCDLYYDVGNHCCAADSVTLCGIVRLSNDNKGVDQSLHTLYIEVFAMRNSNNDSDRGGVWSCYNEADHQLIRDIFGTENLFSYLVTSLCPSIYGQEFVKAGILLSLFGGTPPDENKSGTRPDINILMVGDPGLGKSQMLKIINQVAPRGVYVCGSGSTAAGLTVTLVRDGSSYSLDAGALVMADKGVCCIDEFDKMQQQHSALLEAMEQQSVSLAKAGVFRTIPARTAVIAAANPAAGHYDDNRSVSDNIKISAPLLSRFDLIFIMKDRPDEEHDRQIVQHIMNFSGKNERRVHTSVQPDANDKRKKFFLQKLRAYQGEYLEHEKFRKYIAYAKQYVKPKLSKEAAAVLKLYYTDLRENYRSVDSTPVTMRQLQSLARLAEARAKLELREIVTEDDARDIVRIFEFSMKGVYDDDLMASSGTNQTGSNTSQLNKSGASRSQTKNKAKKFIAELEQVAERSAKNLFSLDEMKVVAAAIGMSNGSDFNTMIDHLNNLGFLLKKGPRTYQMQYGGA